MIGSLIVILNVLIPVAALADGAGAGDIVVLKNDTFSLGLAADARPAHFIDRATGTDYLDASDQTKFAAVKRGTELFPATSVVRQGDQLHFDFATAKAKVVLDVKTQPRGLVFVVSSVEGEGIDEITFGYVPLTLKGDISEAFGASPLALDINTSCVQIPGASPDLGGFTAYRKFGLVGAKGAIVAAPMKDLRVALQDAAMSSQDVPHSPLGGPWALDARINQGSYVIDGGGTISEENVTQWIEVAKSVGATQIDFHGGHAFRWGDCEPNLKLYPRGRASLKAVVDAIHDAGMAAGLHTYAFFLAKETPWVTPVPNPDLDKDATFTLGADLAVGDSNVPVEESTGSMSAVTGFHVRNSVTIQIDDELIKYTGIVKEAPYAFTGCERGAYGTKVAAHARGAKVYHLKECFGLFTPKGDSKLFTEVAQRTADIYNDCGFDMIYLDALDGSDIVGGWENAWHYGAKFTYELVQRLKKPAVVEMSTFTHHLWLVRSRMEAWDVPSRAQKPFVDIHVLRNRRWQNAFLPTHLGWWGVFNWDGIHPERSFTDDFEYVCAKALATDSSLSYLVGFTPEGMKGTNAKRMSAIAREYEALRQSQAVPATIREQLAQPGKDYTLRKDESGGFRFLPARYTDHRVVVGTAPAMVTEDNVFEAQPLRFRIQTDMSTEDFDSPRSQILTQFGAGEFGPPTAQEGVTGTLVPAADGSGAILTAENTSAEPGAAWLAFKKEFEKPVDARQKGLGVWIDGDGQGAVLNFQLRSPDHLAGGLADHYVKVDFTGRRYFSLVEPESDDLTRYQWAHTRRWQDFVRNPERSMMYAYPMYHIWVNYENIGSLTVGINNLPAGKTVKLGIGPVKALPLVSRSLDNPTVTLGGKTLRFPVSLKSGSYLEYLGPSECNVYDAMGELVAAVSPEGTDVQLMPGANSIEMGSTAGTQAPVRATMTVMSVGEPLKP